ncbi:MAG: hypothetical protein J0H29_13245 [Sphingobacteriales bacterium]|nr:hypothetical protein [Sphingobacteriales bacterium]OJY86343.1 MAG: hypothetical protein BGP14_20425 [Sphingobacteriales bacterium 44-15]
MTKELPVYKMRIESDDEGLSAVALVSLPAIERNFVSFSANKPVKFQINNEEKRIVTGALLLADTPVYRNDENGEYYVIIEKDEVFKTAQKYFKDGLQASVNEEHGNNFFKGVTLFESFIVDSNRGINAPDPELYGTIKDGSWVGSFFVENDEVWNEIKQGTFKGFSVEGFFSFKEISLNKEKEKTPLQELVSALQELQTVL